MEEQLTILVIDDDAVDRMAVRRALRSAGIPLTIAEADSGAAALAACEQTAFDCVFLDYRLPDIDGLVVLREIRARGHATPVVMLTGQGDEQLAVELMKAGATDYLAKGAASPERLAQTLRNALRVYRAEMQAEQAEQALRRAAAEQRLLAEASQILASSLDYEATLAGLAGLAVAEIADWCIVDIVFDDGSVERLAAAHRDPSLQARIEAFQPCYPTQADEPSTLNNVLQTGKPELIAEITPELLEAIAMDGEQLALLRDLGLRSRIRLPLIARDRILGVLTLAAARRTYGPDDMRLAEDLARRAAVAIDNARLYREAQLAVRSRDEFLTMASHELKNPLTSLLGNAQLLERRVKRDGSLGERDQRAIHVIVEQAARLDKMIAALLDISRLQSGQLAIQRETLDLDALVRHLVEEILPTLEQHTISLTGPASPLQIVGDELRLQQVFENLIHNAIKYSPFGGPITVTIERRGDAACVAVSDQGIGIAQSAIPALFSRFYRAPNAQAHRIGGIGMGLYVVQEIVTLHGGSVTVNSVEGQGSTFTVCIPCS
jgi:signal transduction histidine kinase/CheY-like chemotaxis protein